VVLRPNHKNRSHRFVAKPGEPIDLGFEAKPRNSCFSSPCAWYKPHMVSPDLPIVQPSSTRPVFDRHQSSTPSLLLLPRYLSLPTMSHLSPTHHETSKHDSPHEHIGVKQLKYLGFEFKPRQVNDSSQSNQGTDHLVSHSGSAHALRPNRNSSSSLFFGKIWMSSHGRYQICPGFPGR
jgi:hypothetical protein